MFDINWIQGKVGQCGYYFTKHGEQERQNDNLTIAEVEEALLKKRGRNNFLNYASQLQATLARSQIPKASK